MVEFISNRFSSSGVKKTEDWLHGICRLIRGHIRATDCTCLYDDFHIGLLITHATPAMGQLIMERVRALLAMVASRDGKEVVFSQAGLGMVGLDGNLGQTPTQWIDAALTAARTSMAFVVDFTRKETSPMDYQ